MRAEKVDPLRRGVDGAVVRKIPATLDEPNRVRIVRRAELVQDAAGLFLTAWVVRDTLQPGEIEQRRAAHGFKIVEEIHRHADRVATEQAMKQAVSARRGQQRTPRAQLAQALDATKLTQDTRQGAALGRDGRVTLRQSSAKHSKSKLGRIELIKRIGPEPHLLSHIRVAIRR